MITFAVLVFLYLGITYSIGFIPLAIMLWEEHVRGKRYGSAAIGVWLLFLGAPVMVPWYVYECVKKLFQ